MRGGLLGLLVLLGIFVNFSPLVFSPSSSSQGEGSHLWASSEHVNEGGDGNRGESAERRGEKKGRGSDE